MTFFNSSLRSLRLVKPKSPSNRYSNANNLVTKDLKITLGSRVDGRGRFLGSTMDSTMEQGPTPFSENVHSISAADVRSPTHRELYEESEHRIPPSDWPLHAVAESQARSSDGDRCHEDPELGLSTQLSSQHQSSLNQERPSDQAGWRKALSKLTPHRAGYWDMLSIFRSDGGKSVPQSTSAPEKMYNDF